MSDNKDRDQRLTEAMGGCWHDWPMLSTGERQDAPCKLCGKVVHVGVDRTDFSTGDGFIKLWDWAIASSQRWNTCKHGDFWAEFCFANGGSYVAGFATVPCGMVQPNRFADALDLHLHWATTE